MVDSFITPPPAEPGDRVAVIAPSSGAAAIARNVLSLACERLRACYDLRPVLDPTARQSDEFLRSHPEARAAAIHAAFSDPAIAAVFATIGGEDQLRVLNNLDTDVLRDNPTRFFGMSDNTNLHLALYEAGVVGFYGGQLLNQVGTPGSFPEYSERYLRRALFEDSLGDLEESDVWTDDIVEWTSEDFADTEPEYEQIDGWQWRDRGPVSGRVWGGCLPVLHWQCTADAAVPSPDRLDGTVLAIETAENLPSAQRVRWALQAIGERGLLERFDGVLVGRPQTRNRFEDPGPEEREQFRRDQRASIETMIDRYNPSATAVFDVEFGHTNPTAPIPIGGHVAIDPETESITFA
jgi:muramoyltetrapeptide carboxypeptidase LdcA involved in peptidoglycan recycling